MPHRLLRTAASAMSIAQLSLPGGTSPGNVTTLPFAGFANAFNLWNETPPFVPPCPTAAPTPQPTTFSPTLAPTLGPTARPTGAHGARAVRRFHGLTHAAGSSENQGCFASVAFDAAGNCSVVGLESDAAGSVVALGADSARQGVLARWTPTGALDWARASFGHCAPLFTHDLAVHAASGTFYVSGYAARCAAGAVNIFNYSTASDGCFLSQWTASGERSWVRHVNPSVPARLVCGAAADGVVCAGAFSSLSSLLRDYPFANGSAANLTFPAGTATALLVQKWSTQGLLSWARFLPDIVDAAHAVAVSQGGVVYVASSGPADLAFGSPAAGSFAHVSMFTAAGALVWSRRLLTQATPVLAPAFDAPEDASRPPCRLSLAASGGITGAHPNSDIVTWATSGAELWRVSLPGLSDVAADASGSLFVVKRNSDSSMLAAVWNASGQFVSSEVRARRTRYPQIGLHWNACVLKKKPITHANTRADVCTQHDQLRLRRASPGRRRRLRCHGCRLPLSPERDNQPHGCRAPPRHALSGWRLRGRLLLPGRRRQQCAAVSRRLLLPRQLHCRAAVSAGVVLSRRLRGPWLVPAGRSVRHACEQGHLPGRILLSGEHNGGDRLQRGLLLHRAGCGIPAALPCGRLLPRRVRRTVAVRARILLSAAGG